MRAVCKCGHKVTFHVSKDKEPEWEEYAKKCLCKECYEIKTGRSCNQDTVMVGDKWAMS
jgi:hypothetical protein